MCSFIVDMYLTKDLKMTNDLKSLAIIFHNRARLWKILKNKKASKLIFSYY